MNQNDNLPPGCTDKDIEDATCGGNLDECSICEGRGWNTELVDSSDPNDAEQVTCDRCNGQSRCGLYRIGEGSSQAP